MATSTRTRSTRPAPAQTVPAGEGSHLSTEELTLLEYNLRRELERATRATKAMNDDLAAEAAETRPTTGDIADNASDIANKENATLLASRSNAAVRELQGALDRLTASPETFGRCEKCAQGIPFGRLDFMPTAKTCMKCAGKR